MQNKVDDIVINFQSITVKSIENSSGIFIGKNSAIGWSAHGKSNQGLGSANGKIVRSVNLVYDNDLVDSPVEHRDITIDNNMCLSTEVKETANIAFDRINVTSLTSNSAVSVGQNKQSTWDAHSKANTGISGADLSLNNTSLIDDTDIIDSPINYRGTKANI